MTLRPTYRPTKKKEAAGKGKGSRTKKSKRKISSFEKMRNEGKVTYQVASAAKAPGVHATAIESDNSMPAVQSAR